MLKIISNGSKWYGEKPDSIEILKEVLKTQTLDPTFENFGNFINNNPRWTNKEAQELYKGCSTIFGNFKTYSHVFNIITNDRELITELQELINKNKNTLVYQEYKEELKQKKNIINKVN
jgi:hypothetical protein